MRSILLLPIVALSTFLAIVPVHAQPAPVNKDNLLTLSTSQSVKAPQDYLVITLSATREGPNGAAVQSNLKTIVDAALAKSNGFKSNDVKVKTNGFRVTPVYDRDQQLKHWRGTASIVVEGKDMVNVSTLAANIKDMTVVNTGFGLSDAARGEYEARAQKMAIDDFRAKAKVMTEQFGFVSYTIDNVMVNASNESFVPMRAPMEMSMAKSMASPIPVEAGESVVTVHVSGTVRMGR